MAKVEYNVAYIFTVNLEWRTSFVIYGNTAKLQVSVD